MTDNACCCFLVIFKDETHPDEIEGAHAAERLIEIPADIFDARRRKMFPGMSQASLRGIDADRGSPRLHQVMKEVRGLSRTAADIGYPHPRPNAGPTRLLRQPLEIGFMFEARGFRVALHQVCPLVHPSSSIH